MRRANDHAPAYLQPDDLVEAIRLVLTEVLIAQGDPPRASRPLQAGDVVSEDRAARALPLRRSDAVAWLRAEGLSRPLGGRRVVVWGAVLDRLRAAPPQPRRGAQQDTIKPLAVPGRILD